MRGSVLLAARRKAILEHWRDTIFATYPGPTADLLRKGKDRFRNPAGDAIRRGTEGVLDGLIRGAPRDEIADALDAIVRLRAVQEFAPAQAVAFVFGLKPAVRAALGPEGEQGEAAALAEIDGAVDALALTAFDLYAACREKILEIRLAESRARLGKTLERAEARVLTTED